MNGIYVYIFSTKFTHIYSCGSASSISDSEVKLEPLYWMMCTKIIYKAYISAAYRVRFFNQPSKYRM